MALLPCPGKWPSRHVSALDLLPESKLTHAKKQSGAEVTLGGHMTLMKAWGILHGLPYVPSSLVTCATLDQGPAGASVDGTGESLTTKDDKLLI